VPFMSRLVTDDLFSWRENSMVATLNLAFSSNIRIYVDTHIC